LSRADKLKLIIKAAAAMGLVVVIVLAMYLREPAQPAADGGAQWGGAVEKDVNLAITLQLREILLATGYRVALTRYGDYSLIEEEEASNPKKREDMARRLAVIEKHQPDIVILIHCNAIRSTQWSGAQTFYQEGFDQGKLLAEDIQHYLREFTATTRQARPLDLYLLRESSIVGSLVEAGFLSNPAERDLLLQRGYQRILATATWLGISKYLHESGLALED